MFSPLLGATPPTGWLLVVLGVYALVFVPLALAGLGRVGRRGLAWVVLPVFAVVTAAGLWLYVHQQVTS